MFSDIAGYTALMGHDEQKALRALEAHRALLRSLMPRFNGSLIGEIGDGTLTSFRSALDAVNCAREIQAALRDDELRLRIGIHVGDVVFSQNNVHGDGVNVASRIHALAPAGGICISERVFEDIRNKPDIRARDLGKKRLKNVSRPIRIYALAAVSEVPVSTSIGVARRPIAIAIGVVLLVVLAVLIALRVIPKSAPKQVAQPVSAPT